MVLVLDASLIANVVIVFLTLLILVGMSIVILLACLTRSLQRLMQGREAERVRHDQVVDDELFASIALFLQGENMRKIDFDEEVAARELLLQINVSYLYLASLSPPNSIERNVYQSVKNDIDSTLSVAGAALGLKKRIKARKGFVADRGWTPELRERWQEDVICCEQILGEMEQFGGTDKLLEWLQQCIRERLT